MGKSNITAWSFSNDRNTDNAEFEIPNAETIAAIEEAERMKTDLTLGKTYDTVDEMMRDLLN